MLKAIDLKFQHSNIGPLELIPSILRPPLHQLAEAGEKEALCALTNSVIHGPTSGYPLVRDSQGSLPEVVAPGQSTPA